MIKYKIKLDMLPILQSRTTDDLTAAYTKEEWLPKGFDPEKLTEIFEQEKSLEVQVKNHGESTNVSFQIPSQDLEKFLKELALKFNLNVDEIVQTSEQRAKLIDQVMLNMGSIQRTRYCSAPTSGLCGCIGCVNTNIPFIDAGITHEEWTAWMDKNKR